MKNYSQAQPQGITTAHKGSHQKGLTLIELMISITLGLLLSAAAAKLFAGGINMYRTQSSVANIQDTVVFGLDYVEGQAAMANLGSTVSMTKDSAWTGIVLTGSKADPVNADNQIGNLRGLKGSAEKYVTRFDESGKTDQLVIQYKAPYDMKDCKGNAVKGPHYDSTAKKMIDGEMLIQSFYLKDAELLCDAGRYEADPRKFDVSKLDAAKNVAANSFEITGFDGAVSLMKPVSKFQVTLGVKANANADIRYMTVKEYKNLAGQPPIMSIKIDVTARGKDKVNAGSHEYVERDYSTTVKFRNGHVS